MMGLYKDLTTCKLNMEEEEETSFEALTRSASETLSRETSKTNHMPMTVLS